MESCRILNGVCSLYHRIDDRSRSLEVWSSYHPARDLEKIAPRKGRICWEATVKNVDTPTIFPDLTITPYYTSDPNIQKYGLKSYIGFPIKVKDTLIGCLCVVDTVKRDFSEDDIHILETLAAALSLEEERQNEEERYRNLVENANDAIYITQDGVVKYTNPRLSELSGYPPSELIGKVFIDIVHPMINRCFRKITSAALEGKYSPPLTLSDWLPAQGRPSGPR